MASNIQPYNIDGTFPVAGQDNSSQGFRDNFTNIKNNFIFAQSEIDDLQNKVLVTAALNGQSIVNDMAGTQIRRPQLAAWTQTLYELGTVSGYVPLDFNLANFHKMTTATSINLDFPEGTWPTSIGTGALGYGLMRVWIELSESYHTITLPASVNIGIEEISGAVVNEDGTTTISFDAAGNYIFDFSSIDGGTSYLVFDVIRNHSTFRDSNFYFNDTVNSTLFVGYRDGLQVALQLEQGQDIISALGSYNSVSAGDLSQANISHAQLDTGSLAGYSITSMRGNLQTSTIEPVMSNDLLGYLNSITYTGTNGTSNVFQQTSSINFFATGSNVEYGLGGNIAFFTADDGGAGPNELLQALGIENDQSVQLFGNLDVTNSTNISSLATNANVVFNNFSGEVIVNRIDNGNVYKFLVGGGRACLMGSTDQNWTYANSTPSANVTIDGSMRMEYLTGPSRYVFTNLGSDAEHHFFGIKTRNLA